MKALILAGGFGTRMRPLTYTRPKHLLPIANVPHIEHIFDLLQRHDVNEAVLLTSYLADAFDETVARAADRGLKLEITHEAEPLGTAGALRNAKDLVGNETFLTFNGDVLTDFDLGDALRFHDSRGAETTLVLTPVEDPSAFGVVPTDSEGLVQGFIEKPPPGEAPTNLINAGIYVMEPSVLDRIPEGQVYSAERELFPAIAADGFMYALRSDAYWMDLGTPEKFLQANVDALEGRYACDAVPEPGPGRFLVGVGAEIQDGARVSSSCLGSGTRIGAGSSVQRAVLLPGVVVGANATIDNATLGEGVCVAPGGRVTGVAIGDNEMVHAS
ncbi:MAG: sugar phosphate nucleotidyltransferase [Actinomycetota bacterium]